MKYLFVLALMSSLAIAQEIPSENPTENPTSQPTKIIDNAPAEPAVAFESDLGAPVGIDVGDEAVVDMIQGLFLRIHTVQVDNQIKEMKRDGVSGRNYVIGMTVEGAIVYNHEWWGDSLRDNRIFTARENGILMLPYKIKIDSDGSVNLRISGAAFRNMNAAILNKGMGGLNWRYCPNNYKLCGWKFFDNIDFLTYQYNNDLAREIREHRIEVANVNMKLALAKSTDGRFYVAVKGGLNPVNYHWTVLQDFKGERLAFNGFSSEVKYGLELAYTSRSGWKLVAAFDLKNRWDFYEGALPEESDCSYDCERSETGTRHQWVMNPKIELSKKIQTKGSPVRIGAKLEGNLIIEDMFRGTIKGDVRNGSGVGTIFNGSIFGNF